MTTLTLAGTVGAIVLFGALLLCLFCKKCGVCA